MKFICIQAGHLGRTSGNTGAPGEMELNRRVWIRLSEILQSKGFMVQLVGADPSSVEIDKDFDLFLSLHGDADIYGTGGGCVASGDPAVDSSHKESGRIRDKIRNEYFRETGIVEHGERVNANMTHYYMWDRLSKNTPCVILEMGVVQDAHDKVILADTDRVAIAIAKGICRAFDVNYELADSGDGEVVKIPVDCGEYREEIDRLIGLMRQMKSRFESELAVKDRELLGKMTAYKQNMSIAIAEAIESVKQ